METKEDFLRNVGIQVDRLQEEKPMLLHNIESAMENYHQAKLKLLGIGVVIKSVCDHKDVVWNGDAGCFVCDDCNEKAP